MATTADLVGPVEVAERLGVQRATIRKWQSRDVGFPKPRLVLSGVPIWMWPDVEEWREARSNGPQSKLADESVLLARAKPLRADHCKYGHEMTEENTYRWPDGTHPECIKCVRDREARLQAEAKARSRSSHPARRDDVTPNLKGSK